MFYRRVILLFLFIFFNFQTLAIAEKKDAKVSKISQKNSAIQIDFAGSKDFVKGAKVCILSEKGKKIACSALISAKENEGVLKVEKDVIKDIKKGFKVVLEDKDASKKEPEGKNLPFMVAKALWAGALMPQATYQHVNYLPVSSKVKSASLWQQTGAASALGLSFVFELEKPSWNTALGFRFRQYQEGIFSENYNSPADVYGVSGSISASSIGFYADYALFSFIGLDFAFGLDIDMNTLTLTATKTDDSKKTADVSLAEVSSSLTVISLRFPITYKLALGSFGMHLGGSLLLPLSGAATGTATINDTDHKNSLNSSITQDQDLLSQIDHKKNSLAFELLAGMSYGF